MFTTSNDDPMCLPSLLDGGRGHRLVIELSSVSQGQELVLS